MKITNKLGLPEAIVLAVQNDAYTPGDSDISVPRLIAPAWQAKLLREHSGDIVEDASDRIYSLMGQAVHAVLERAAEIDKSDAIYEKRFYVTVGDKKIGGQIDRFDPNTGTIQDYKQTSVWTHTFGLKPENIAQANIYKHLLEENGHAVEKLENICIYRDWMKSKAKVDADYAQHQIGVIRVPWWSEEETLEFINGRLEAHANPEPCTDAERWKDPAKWAVKKTGRKSALRVLPSKDEALEWAKSNGHMKENSDDLATGIFLEERPSVAKRCLDYCAVSEYCSLWKSEKGEEK